MMRTALRIGALVSVLATSACSAAAMQAFAEGMAASQAAPSTGRLLVFGGEGHDTFLGCLSCNRYDASSIFNKYGQYGSRYQSGSILNKYGSFGSKYSPHSACNPYASDPPIVVTEDGQAIGRLTVSRYNVHRIKDRATLQWLAAVCAD